MSVFAMTGFLSSCGIKTEQADLVIHNANIYAMDGSVRPYGAMAIRGDSILELGPDRQILNKYRSGTTIDAGKKAVYPGFIDAHCHFLEYGLSLSRVNLFGCGSFEEVIERTKRHADAHDTPWIQGRGWDQNLWDGGSFPTNERLNELWPDKPVFLRRVDGHAAIANDKALELAAIDGNSKMIGGMVLLKDGRPTGVLIDRAMELVEAVIPPPDENAKRKAIEAAQRDCFALGLTSVADAGLSKDNILLIRKMHEEGSLLMPIYAMIRDAEEDIDYFINAGTITDDRLTVCSVKCYADGALGSRGACLIGPYSDMPGHHGMMLDEGRHYEEVAAKLLEAGFQMNTHCIGDSAARFILQVYGHHLKGPNDLRWRIEHAQVIHPSDFEFFGKYSIIPSVQPTHATSDMYWAEERLGPDRIGGAYAYEDLRKQLGMIALGTDFPIEQVNPMLTFYAAVVRQDLAGFPDGGFEPANALSREHALAGMTLWAAIANREEHKRGSLEPGKKADFIMTDRDIMTAPASALPETKILRTFVHGQEVYSIQR